MAETPSLKFRKASIREGFALLNLLLSLNNHFRFSLCLCGYSTHSNKKALPGPIGLLAESGKPYAGVTLTTFLLSGPFTAKVTLPSILANNV